MARYGYRSSSYSGDPYWTTAKFDSITADGTRVKKGQDIFYYPKTKTVLVGEKAEQASRDFNAAKADEDFMGGGGGYGGGYYRNPRRNPKFRMPPPKKEAKDELGKSFFARAEAIGAADYAAGRKAPAQSLALQPLIREAAEADRVNTSQTTCYLFSVQSGWKKGYMDMDRAYQAEFDKQFRATYPEFDKQFRATYPEFGTPNSNANWGNPVELQRNPTSRNRSDGNVPYLVGGYYRNPSPAIFTKEFVASELAKMRNRAAITAEEYSYFQHRLGKVSGDRALRSLLSKAVNVPFSGKKFPKRNPAGSSEYHLDIHRPSGKSALLHLYKGSLPECRKMIKNAPLFYDYTATIYNKNGKPIERYLCGISGWKRIREAASRNPSSDAVLLAKARASLKHMPVPNPGLTKAGKRHLIQTMHKAGADTFRKKIRYVSKHMPHIDDPAAFVGYVMQGEKR